MYFLMLKKILVIYGSIRFKMLTTFVLVPHVSLKLGWEGLFFKNTIGMKVLNIWFEHTLRVSCTDGVRSRFEREF